MTAFTGALMALATGFTDAFVTGFEAGLVTGFATGLALVLETDLAAPLETTFTADFAADLTTGLAAGLGAALGDAFGAAFFTTGLPLLTALEGAALTVDGFVAFLAGAITFAFDLLDGLIFFAAVFELVLRGFFTSCLLAVAAYASFKDTSHLQMNCGHRLICVKTHIFDLLGASGLQLRDPVRAQIVATEQP